MKIAHYIVDQTDHVISFFEQSSMELDVFRVWSWKHVHAMNYFPCLKDFKNFKGTQTIG